MPFERRDISIGITRLRNTFPHNVTDRHLVVNVEALGNDVLAIELMANDTGANGVAIKADEQVEKCSTVTDFDVSRAIEIDGGKGFFGKVK